MAQPVADPARAPTQGEHHMNTLLKVSAILSALAWPLAALSQSNEAFIEKSKIIGGGNVIHLYGLAAKDSTGKTKYWDTTITLEIGANGKPTGNSASVSVPQAKEKSTEFVPGVDVDAGGNYNCTLSNSPFLGRTEFDLHCTYLANGLDYVSTWFTGPIAGHPWEADLVAAQLDTLPGNEEYAWGKALQDNNSSFFGCFNDPEMLSARQVGDTITLVNYGFDKVFDCQMSLFRQP
jgi:hypothetical protein